MLFDPKYASTLLDPFNYKVFNTVASARRIALGDLWKSIGSEDRVSESVEKLSVAGLIKEEPASLKDFSTLYVTAEGLNAERQIRRQGDLFTTLVESHANSREKQA
ncbi:MAG TPA: hypothetical protein VEK84_15115 [Terriglobales bacterium]|nr:hypothetical protein [Terriglobales bacterium]